jgi:hypothetical protein
MMLDDLMVHDPIECGGLTVFALTGGGSTAPFEIGRSALDAGTLTIDELNGGSVPELVVHNHGAQSVLLFEGDILLGLRQDRTLNTTVLCGPGTTVIPVSCVQRGRWGASQQPMWADQTASPRLRRVKTDSVNYAAMLDASRRSDQGAVWSAVDTHLSERQIHSPSAALHDAFSLDDDPTDSLMYDVEPIDGQQGMVAATANGFTFEWCSHPETFAHRYAPLLRGCALDARRALDTAVRPDDARAFIDRVRSARWEERPGVGQGVELALSSDDLSGIGLSIDGALVHLAAFGS